MSSAAASPPLPQPRAALTLLDVLRRSTAFLARAGVPQPRLEAELLIAWALGVTRLQLYLQFDRPLDEEELQRPREALRQRARGVPTAYLLGHREFMGLEIAVSPEVLIPRPESELLVELALARLGGLAGPHRVADIGTGSGCLAAAVALRDEGARVDASDVSEAALEVARANVEHLGVADSVSLLRGSWARPLVSRGPYSLVISNPPYVTGAELAELDPSVREHEPHLALDGGEDGLRAYRELLPELPPLMASPGTVLLEIDPRRGDAVRLICRQTWPLAEVRCHLDLSQRERVVEVALP